METNPNTKTVAEVMTRDVEVIRPQQTMREAARKMDVLNVGVLPVCERGELVGVVTDRDMVVRGVASGAASDVCTIAEVMTPDAEYCYDDESVEEAAERMAALQIRRIFVLDRDKRLVGVLSLGDVAVDNVVAPRDAAGALKTISSRQGPSGTRECFGSRLCSIAPEQFQDLPVIIRRGTPCPSPHPLGQPRDFAESAAPFRRPG